MLCDVRFPDREDLDGHLCIGKLKGRRKGRPRKYVKPTKKWRAKLEKSKIKESQTSKAKRGDADKANGSVITSTPKRTRGRPKAKVKNEYITFDIPEVKAVIEGAVTVQTEIGSNNAGVNTEEDDMDMTGLKDEDFDESLHIDDEETSPIYTEDEMTKPVRRRGPRLCREPLTCPECGEKFVAEVPYHIHVYQHTGIKPFICQHLECGRGFLSKFKLERHTLIHTSPRHHKCPYCDKCFNRKDHLKNHMITHDPNKKIYRCEICAKEYCYSFSYRIHMAFHKAENGELMCGICKKMFENKDQMLFHLKIHTGARAAKNSSEKTHPCADCGKKFFTRKDVKRHMVTHTKRKDFLCQFCPQSFGRKDHLTRHLKTSHSGDNVNTGVKSRRNAGDGVVSPSKVKNRQLYSSNLDSQMAPFPVSLQAVPGDELPDQLINGVTQVSQNGSIGSTQTTFLQNLQYAMSRDNIQLTGAIYEAVAASAQDQQQPQQQQQQQQQTQVTPVNNLQPTAVQSIQANLPVQYQINDKGYIMSTQQPEQQTVVRQIQLSPNIDYKQLTQQLQQGNMFIQAAPTATIQQQEQQQQQQQQVQTIQQIPIQIQQQQLQQPLTQAIIGKLEAVANNSSNNITILQQPPEYQLAGQPVSIVPAVSAMDQTRPSLVLANTVDNKQNPHPQTYSTLLGYMETLRFLENLPTNNTNTIPVQQLQAVNIEVTQPQAPQILQAATYNAVAASGGNILNINQADLAKGVVAISNPHGGTLQLTPQEFKNVVSLAQSVNPVQQVTYQQHQA